MKSTTDLKEPSVLVRDVAETKVRRQRDSRGTRISLWVFCHVEECNIRGESSTRDRATNRSSRKDVFE